MTRDIDLTLFTGFGGEETYIQTLLGSYEPRRRDAAEFARRNRVLLLTASEGTSIDVSLGALPFEESAVERATYFNFGGEVALRTCSAEDLIWSNSRNNPRSSIHSRACAAYKLVP